VLGHAAGGHGNIFGHVEEVPKVRDEHDARYRRLLRRPIPTPPTEAASRIAGRETPIASSRSPASSGGRTVVASNSVDRGVNPGAAFFQEFEVKASPGDTLFSDPVDYHTPHLHPRTVTARP
jgi:hypothetical protein